MELHQDPKYRCWDKKTTHTHTLLLWVPGVSSPLFSSLWASPFFNLWFPGGCWEQVAPSKWVSSLDVALWSTARGRHSCLLNSCWSFCSWIAQGGWWWWGCRRWGRGRKTRSRRGHHWSRWPTAERSLWGDEQEAKINTEGKKPQTGCWPVIDHLQGVICEVSHLFEPLFGYKTECGSAQRPWKRLFCSICIPSNNHQAMYQFPTCGLSWWALWWDGTWSPADTAGYCT